jgi:hypothetical protein
MIFESVRHEIKDQPAQKLSSVLPISDRAELITAPPVGCLIVARIPHTKPWP